MTDGVCFITIQGQRMGCYELDDRAAQRSLLKQVYRACQATQAQLWERIGPVSVFQLLPLWFHRFNCRF